MCPGSTSRALLKKILVHCIVDFVNRNISARQKYTCGLYIFSKLVSMYKYRSQRQSSILEFLCGKVDYYYLLLAVGPRLIWHHDQYSVVQNAHRD